jgi:hypothetical protein
MTLTKYVGKKTKFLHGKTMEKDKHIGLFKKKIKQHLLWPT